MMSLSEMFESPLTRPGKQETFVISTYTAREAGNLDLSYQLEMTVNASVPTPAKRDELETFVNKMGYEFRVDSQNNTVRVYSLDRSIDISEVLKFIKTCIDENATEQRMG